MDWLAREQFSEEKGAHTHIGGKHVKQKEIASAKTLRMECVWYIWEIGRRPK